ncbi:MULTISPECIES: hypothetical protein [unclassified Streptomyces]|uniref:hypothetical protein n=1 Tax=unclassified Streptomyces TaxID=2593676 RepID=UPI002256C9F0|nr:MULTISPECIES: hypothetical protein [unclassified Streptomyces]MCX4881543.1 hypothetical protein [Streptomyces sp. NBC_00847]MCX5421556.1 hypothetical protein [Streptomyces sp. NBC_00078]
MHLRGRGLRYTAVLAFVVLSLTGFTGRSHGHHGIGKSHGSSHHGGGGCSSSAQDHDSSSSSSHRYYDDDDDDYGSSSGSSGGSVGTTPTPTATSLQDATVKLVRCASAKAPYATVEVTNPNAAGGTFTVSVTFKDKRDEYVVTGFADVDVPANDTATAKVQVGSASLVASVDHCDVDESARASSS